MNSLLVLLSIISVTLILMGLHNIDLSYNMTRLDAIDKIDITEYSDSNILGQTISYPNLYNLGISMIIIGMFLQVLCFILKGDKIE